MHQPILVLYYLGSIRDGGALWAAVHGVAQSRTRLKRLSRSRSIFVLVIALLIFKAKYILTDKKLEEIARELRSRS